MLNGDGDLMEILHGYWPPIIVAIALIVIALLVILRPRQRVRLSEEQQPLRPHMQSAHEDRGLAGEAAAAASDIAGQFIEAPVHAHLPGASGPPDDLQRLKGVGPKFASLLNGLGIARYAQLASLSEGDIERLDSQLGPFRGRLQRDQIPLQADYLARGDEDGFEHRFGKL
jgi:predicted flap endonuclease-1-like 5' DNA nuclease